MQIKSGTGGKIIGNILLFLCISLISSVLSYVLDLLLNFNYAIEQPRFIIAYWIMFLGHFWIYLIGLIIYHILVRTNFFLKNNLRLLLLGTIIGGVIGIILGHNDYSLYIGDFRELKAIIRHGLTGLIFSYLSMVIVPGRTKATNP